MDGKFFSNTLRNGCIYGKLMKRRDGVLTGQGIKKGRLAEGEHDGYH